MIDLSSEYNHKIDKVKLKHMYIKYECDTHVQMFNYTIMMNSNKIKISDALLVF